MPYPVTSSLPDDPALLRLEGPIATITLNRPAAFNSIDLSIARKLEQLGAKIEAYHLRYRGQVSSNRLGSGKVDAALSASAWRRRVSVSHQSLHTNPILGSRNAILEIPLPFRCQGVFSADIGAKTSLPK